MKHLEIPNLPDEGYRDLEILAHARGKSVAEQAAEVLVKGLSANDAAEAALLEEIRKDRDALAAKGVFITDEDIREGIEWGRE